MRTHKRLGKKNRFIMKRAARIQGSRKDLIVSLILNETRLSCVCACHPQFEQRLTLSVHAALLLMQKKKKKVQKGMFFHL